MNWESHIKFLCIAFLSMKLKMPPFQPKLFCTAHNGFYYFINSKISIFTFYVMKHRACTTLCLCYLSESFLFADVSFRTYNFTWLYYEFIISNLHIYSNEADKPDQSVDPDQMLQNVASDQSLSCLLLIQQSFRFINRK